MDTTFRIRNFRIYNNEGARLDLRPISIITGRNSSGKSTAVKALVLLRDFFEQARRTLKHGDYLPANYYLDFSASNLKLAGIDNVKNKGCNENEDVVFSYEVEPICSSYSFTVEMRFNSRPEDKMKYGWLNRITIYSLEEEIFVAKVEKKEYKEAGSGTEYNFILDSINLDSAFLMSFIRFYGANLCAIASSEVEQCYDGVGGTLVSDEEISQKEDIREYVSTQAIEKLKLYKEELAKYNLLVNDDDIFSRHKRLFTELNDEAFFSWLDSNTLFYLPILEEFKGIDKEDVPNVFEEMIQRAVIPETGRRRSSFMPEKLENNLRLVLKDFSESDYSFFNDYYLSFENSFLGSPGADAEKYSLITRFKHNNFISGLRMNYDLQAGDMRLSSISKKNSNGVSFETVYDLMIDIQSSIDEVNNINSAFINIDYDISSGQTMVSHKVYRAYMEYLEILLTQILIPDSFKDIRYLGSSHITVKRLYSFDESDTMTLIIKNYINSSRDYLEYKGYHSTSIRTARGFHGISKEAISDTYLPGTFTDKWLSNLGYGKSLKVEVDEEGYGAKLKISYSEDGLSRPVADEGFGVSQLISLLLRIEGEYLAWRASNLSIKTKGMVIDSYSDMVGRDLSSQENLTLCIEEPEISLHPNLQSKLTDIFMDAYNEFGIHFIIETHSEYIIRRCQSYVARNCNSEKDLENLPFTISYIADGGETYRMSFLEDCSGRFSRSFGEGFLDESSFSNIDILNKEREIQHEKN